MSEKKEGRVVQSVSMSPQLRERLHSIAEENEWSASQTARKALEIGLQIFEEQLKLRARDQRQLMDKFLTLHQEGRLEGTSFDEEEN